MRAYAHATSSLWPKKSFSAEETTLMPSHARVQITEEKKTHTLKMLFRTLLLRLKDRRISTHFRFEIFHNIIIFPFTFAWNVPCRGRLKEMCQWAGWRTNVATRGSSSISSRESESTPYALLEFTLRNDVGYAIASLLLHADFVVAQAAVRRQGMK